MAENSFSSRAKFATMMLIFISISSISFSNVKAIDQMAQVSIHYYAQPGCSFCEEREALVNTFLSEHATINYSRSDIVLGENSTEFLEYLDSIGIDRQLPPLVIFEKGDCFFVLQGEDITIEALDSWYSTFSSLSGECPDWSIADQDLSEWAVFTAGLITGISPCVILITAVLSTALVIQEDRKRLISLFLGFLCGVLLMYVLLGIALASALSLLAQTFFGTTIRWILAIVMIGLGLWYIIDAFNENSKLFKTPEGFKKWIKAWSEKGTFLSSLVLGFVFSFLKIPCVGGILVALIQGISTNTSEFIPKISLFYLGLIIPLIILMFILGWGVQRSKIDTLRIKYRAHLRILSGIIIIALTIYSFL